MEEVRRRWRTPQLVAITRSRPQESVLETCKSEVTSSGPNSAFDACYMSLGVQCAGLFTS